jgi:hypothetical protein
MAKLHGGSFTNLAVDGAAYRAGADGAFDVPDALAERLMADFGFGRLPTADPGRPYVERANGHGGDTAPDAPPDYALMATADLVAEAQRLGLAIPEGANRRKLIAILKEAAQ